MDVAAALGREHDEDTDCGIETLVVFLASNNALQVWSGAGFQDLRREGRYTLWRPDHFATELAELAAAVRGIEARQ